MSQPCSGLIETRALNQKKVHFFLFLITLTDCLFMGCNAVRPTRDTEAVVLREELNNENLNFFWDGDSGGFCIVVLPH